VTATETPTMTLVEATRLALDDALAADPAVFLLGRTSPTPRAAACSTHPRPVLEARC